MSATTVERNTNATVPALPTLQSYSVTAGQKCLAGTMVALVSGSLTPVTASSGGVLAGRANETSDNTATLTPTPTCQVQSGAFYWTNGTSTDAITSADFGGPAYCLDNQTVSRLNTGGTRTFAGVILGIGDSTDPNQGIANMVQVWTPPPGFGQATIAAAIAAGTISAARQSGVATIGAGGSVTVGSVTIAATSKVMLTVNVPAGTRGYLDARSTNFVPGTGTGSFVITSTSATETSTVFYEIIP